MELIADFLEKWRLKLSVAKTNVTIYLPSQHRSKKPTVSWLLFTMGTPTIRHPSSIPWCETGQTADVQTAPRSATWESLSSEQSVTPSGRDIIGCINIYPSHRSPSPGLQHCWICCTSMVQEQPHQKAGLCFEWHPTSHHWMSPPHSDRSPPSPCRDCATKATSWI